MSWCLMWELKFKRRPKPEPDEFKEKLAYVPQAVEHAPKIPSLLTTYSNHISKVFNDYCTEMGVSVRIGMNPADYNRMMWLKVVGNRDVQVYHRGKTYYLAPGEDYTFTISDTDCMTGRIEEFLPRLTLMPYGNSFSESIHIPTGINRQFFQYGELSGAGQIPEPTH